MITTKFGIDINNTVNGAFLYGGKGGLHRSIHTNKYRKWVTDSLKGARTRGEAEAALRGIAKHLKEGTYVR